MLRGLPERICGSCNLSFIQLHLVGYREALWLPKLISQANICEETLGTLMGSQERNLLWLYQGCFLSGRVTAQYDAGG